MPSDAVDQRVILHDIRWETYERLVLDHLDCSAPRFTYDQGVLEIMPPSTGHEEANRNLAFVVRIVAAALSLRYRDVGSMTYKRAELHRGFEPDSSFYLQREPLVRDRRQIDLAVDPPPDLVIEIEISRSALDKLPIYARLGVPEVWRYDGKLVTMHVLAADAYAESTISLALPRLSIEVLTRFLDEASAAPDLDWIQAVSDWARTQRAPDSQL